MIGAAIYARVSSLEQASRESSVPAQLYLCAQYAKAHNLEVVGEYADLAESGMSDDRAEFQRMIADAEGGRFADLIVYRSDRFARLKEDAVHYKGRLRRAGVTLHCVAEPTIEGDESIIVESNIEAFNEYFSRKLSREVKRGLAAKRRGGFLHGAAPFGYRWQQPRSLVPDDREAPTVRLLYRWLEEGMAYHGMVAQLNRMGVLTRTGKAWRYHSNVRRILGNPVYGGYLTEEPKVHRPQVGKHHQKATPRREWHLIASDKWQPLIERERWEAAQGLLAARARKVATPSGYLFSGIARCPICGAALVGRTSNTDRPRPQYRYTCGAEPRAHRWISWRRDALEARILDALECWRAGEDYPPIEFEHTPGSGLDEQRRMMEERLRQIDGETEASKLAYERGAYDVDELLRRLADKKAARQRVIERLKEIETDPEVSADVTPLARTLAQVARSEKLSLTAKKALLASRIKRIELLGWQAQGYDEEARRLFSDRMTARATSAALAQVTGETYPKDTVRFCFYMPARVRPGKPARGIEPPTR